MENVTSSSKMKTTKLRTTANENDSPLRIELDDRGGRYLQQTAMSPRFQPYKENINVGSPLARLLFAGSPIAGRFATAGEAFTPPALSKYRSARAQQYYSSSTGSSSFGSSGRTSLSPLSSIENLPPRMSPPMYGTPVKAEEEEVLVMDDIQVKPMSGGKSGKSSSSSSSGRASSSSSSASSAKSVIKTEICKAWEDSGNCRYNSKCQFAHGKEELHPGRSSMKKTKSEAQRKKSTTRAGSSGSCNNGPNNRIVNQLYAAPESERGVTRSQPASPEPHQTPASSNNTLNDWSPLDDGIEVLLPGSDKAPSREEVDAYINRLRSGPTTKKRLSVFAALSEEEE